MRRAARQPAEHCSGAYLSGEPDGGRVRRLVARLAALAAIAALAATVSATVTEALRDPEHLDAVTTAVTEDPALLELVATVTGAPAAMAATVIDGLPDLLATTDAATTATLVDSLVGDTPLGGLGTLLEASDVLPRDQLALAAASLVALVALLTPPPLGRRAGATGRVLLTAGLPLVALTYGGPWLVRTLAPMLASGSADVEVTADLVAGLAERVLPVVLGPALTLATGLAVAGAALIVVRLVLGARR